MPWLTKSLRNKLVAGSFAAMLALILLPIVYAWSAAQQGRAFEWVAHTNEVIDRVNSIRSRLHETQVLELGYTMTGDETLSRRHREAGEDVLRQIATLRDQVDDSVDRSELVDRMIRSVRTWLDESPSRQPSEPDPSRLPSLIRGEHQSLRLADILAVLQQFEDRERALLAERTSVTNQLRNRNQAIVLVGSGAAVIVFLLLALWLSRSIIEPITELTQAIARVQAGDLRARVTERSPDELGLLGRGFNAMTASLQKNSRDLEKRDIQSGVLQVAQVLAATNDLPHLLDQALEQVLDAAHAQAGAIWIRSTEDESLRALVSIGTGSDVLDRVVRPGDGILGRVAQTRIAYYAPIDTAEAPLTIQHWLGDQRPAEVGYIPLSAGPDLVGILTLASVEPFDDRARNLLRIASGQLGTAIRDAMSHQKLTRQAVELENRNKQLADQQAEIERQNRELRVASQLKSEFLANMSHELRTPLTIVLGFTNTVLRGAQGPLSDEQKDSLRRVYDNAKHLLGLINDILDLSKIEAGQMEIEAESFALAPSLEAIGDNFRPMAGSKGLVLRIETGKDVPDRIVTDETRFRQVVTNLVSNAVKFTDSGEVVLSARRAGHTAVELEVRDTGPGIAEGDIPKIFDQFRQLDGRTTRKAGGTGLGLSIVKRLVELMGGRIDVRSRVGLGTSFVVTLPTALRGAEPPARIPPTQLPATAAGTAEQPGRQLVLAIDDDEDFLTLLRAAFQDTPFSLRCATSGQEGLNLARQLRPDAITLDVMMPEMDGWRVLGDLKSDPRTASIPVILLTVLQRKGLGLMLGATEYLTKPVDRDRLIHVLRQVGPQEGTGTILVVDDDPDIRQMLDVELRAEGFHRIEKAEDGIEGLRKAREVKPDLIVLDLMMPRMDGFDMAAHLQEDPETRRIPVIVLTAKDLTADDIARLNGHIEQIIQKGAMNVDALIQRLVSILRSLGVRPS